MVFWGHQNLSTLDFSKCLDFTTEGFGAVWVHADSEAMAPSLHPQQPVLQNQDAKASCEPPTHAPSEPADKGLLIA